MNDANRKECRFTASILPYMYGEIAVSESSAFESHLLDCGECTDEFAAISNARFEVYEWKQLEFGPLATPRFAIPYEKEKAVSLGASWVEKLRAAFGQGWAIPGVAFAGLAVVSVLAAVVMFSGDDGPRVAKIDNTNTPSASPIAGEASPNKVDPGVIAPAAVENRGDKSDSPASVKVASPGRVEEKRVTRSPRSTQPRAIQTRATSAQNKYAPRLNDFAEDEDTSLRLAELFEDIETSD
jgi:hypothetical protein